MAIQSLRLRFTVPQFKAYVRGLPKPTWGPRCISLHHTFIPNQSTWHGQASVDGIVRYWESLGWTHGVHLFTALENGTPYVYVCNPLTSRGTGVRGRNSDSIHIEHPWNGDVTPFDPRLVAASREVQTAVCDWAGIPVQRTDPNPSVPARGLFYHRWRRDAYKTCPGSRVGDADLIGRPIQPQPVQEVDGVVIPVDNVVGATGHAAHQTLRAAGLLDSIHPLEEAVGNGLLFVLLARLLTRNQALEARVVALERKPMMTVE